MHEGPALAVPVSCRQYVILAPIWHDVKTMLMAVGVLQAGIIRHALWIVQQPPLQDVQISSVWACDPLMLTPA